MELMIEKLLGFVLVLTRVSAFFLILPVFGWSSIPATIKVAMTLLVAFFFSVITSFPIDAEKISATEAVLLIANEASYGLALGLVATALFSAVKLSATIIEREMGFAMGETFDPMTGETAEPLGILLEMMFIIIFLAANGHHTFLLTIAQSYKSFPVGSTPTIALLVKGIVESGSTMLIAGLRLSAPMLAVFLILLVVLAVLARIVPEMDILFMSFPLRVGVGLLMAMIFLPLVNGYVGEFADWMNKLLPL